MFQDLEVEERAVVSELKGACFGCNEESRDGEKWAEAGQPRAREARTMSSDYLKGTVP